MITVEVELLILIVLMVVLASGAIELLRQIRNAIYENYQASLARAMTTTDIAVKVEKEKVVNACLCGHPKSSHSEPAPHYCMMASCACQDFKPKRGLWPGEVKV